MEIGPSFAPILPSEEPAALLRTADNRTMRGRPFEKGVSPNPGGRPRVVAELRELARTHTPNAVKEYARLALKARNEAVRVAAIRELLDRAYGRSAPFGSSTDSPSEANHWPVVNFIFTDEALPNGRVSE